MEPKDWITLSVSSFAFCLSVVNFIRTSRVADRQLVIQFTQDVHKWADQVLMIYADLLNERIADDKDVCLDMLSAAAGKASALFDSGRLLFPNHPAGSFGAEKTLANRGIRPAILDTMKALHSQIVDDYKSDRSLPLLVSVTKYIELKRVFISCAQAEIATRLRYQIVRRLLGSNPMDYREKEAKILAKRK